MATSDTPMVFDGTPLEDLVRRFPLLAVDDIGVVAAIGCNRLYDMGHENEANALCAITKAYFELAVMTLKAGGT